MESYCKQIRNIYLDYNYLLNNLMYEDWIRPSNLIQNNYFLTGDGYEAQDSTLIEKGILKQQMREQYS